MDLTFILIIAAAGIVIGLLLGLIINTLRGESSKSSEQTGTITHGIDNILLWHDQKDENLIVDLDGSTFINASEMNSDQRARLETCFGQLKRFLGVQDATPSVKPAPAQAEKPTLTTVKPQSPVRTTPAIPVEEIIVIPPVVDNKKKSKKPVPVLIKPLSVVGEIDEILQDMILKTPFYDRGLKLVETASHGISVWIDTDRYETIEAVPDPAIQEVIRVVVKKWEDKPR